MDKNNNKQHGKYEKDNIIRKIQVSYISFLTNFVNTVLKTIGRNDIDFTPLNYNFKRIVNKEHRTKLKNSIIEEVLKRTSSPKFSTKDKNINIYICEKFTISKTMKTYRVERIIVIQAKLTNIHSAGGTFLPPALRFCFVDYI